MHKIFISHKHDDEYMARKVYNRVKLQHGYDAYMAAVDEEHLKDNQELAKTLLDRISECQRIIAVISDHTKLSWWVPWEIGIGYAKKYNMASYIEYYKDSLDLPSYIDDWPILTDLDSVDKYCNLSRHSAAGDSQRVQLMEGRTVVKSQIPLMSSDEFHQKLKSWLNERRRS